MNPIIVATVQMTDDRRQNMTLITPHPSSHAEDLRGRPLTLAG